MKASFEEKTFESYFNSELSRRSTLYFPPGQVLEGDLGFDVSALSKNHMLWWRLGYPFLFHPKFSGVELTEISQHMERTLKKQIENIPNIKVNLLIQYKRPEHIKSPKAKEWIHWKKPYYRYDIYKEQQEILSEIHNKFSSKVLVVYASPCCVDVNDLVAIRKDIISNSNIARAVDLDGHHKNTYVKSGSHSIACSEPEEIINIDIIKELEKFAIDESESNIEKIINFSSYIDELITNNDYYGQSFRDLNNDFQDIKDLKLLYSFVVMHNFRKLFGCQWLSACMNIENTHNK